MSEIALAVEILHRGGLVAFPVLLLIAATAAAFGPVLGFLYAAAGSLASATVTYALGLALGRDTLRAVIGPTGKPITDTDLFVLHEWMQTHGLPRLGIDPVWFGVILTINMELGLITPPVGLNLYVINGIAPQVRAWAQAPGAPVTPPATAMGRAS